VRRLGSVDPLAYVRAIPLLVRNPLIVLAPLLASVANVLLFKLVPADVGSGFLGSVNSGLAGLLAQIFSSFGFAVALIVAEEALRRGRASFDDAWDEARRKVGSIALAAIGFNFVVSIGAVIGGTFGSVAAIVLSVVAYFFFIYTLPAAAIGGVPGVAALQASFERAQRTPLATALVTALYLFTVAYVPSLIVDALSPLMFSAVFSNGDVISLIAALLRAIVSGYVALVLAKVYDDASYGRRY
jgi:hypothetical protein